MTCGGATPSASRRAAARRADLLVREFSPRWWIGTAVAFLIPLFGGLAALWNLRVFTNAEPFREVGLPLLISVVEAMPLLLLNTVLRVRPRRPWRGGSRSRRSRRSNGLPGIGFMEEDGVAEEPMATHVASPVVVPAPRRAAHGPSQAARGPAAGD